MARPIPVLALVAWLTAGPAARADGLAFHREGGLAPVRPTAQRAAMWLRQGTWELHVQPVFAREPGGAAWVIPLPVRPEVALDDPEFLDQLELTTAPVFLDVCRELDESCFGQGQGEDTPGVVRGGTSAPEIWERGQLESLDYVILSSADGDDPVAWLRREGYAVPDEALIPLQALAEEGAFFFAARLSAGADPALPLPALRFRLTGLHDPAYPLRLTAAGLPPGEHLDLTLWVLTPVGQDWIPAERNVVLLPSELESRAAMAAALDGLFLAGPDSLALLHSGSLRETGAFEGRICGWQFGCVEFADVGLALPGSWCPEMEIVRESAAWVQRFQARLQATGLREDLRLRPRVATEYLDRVDRTYLRWVCEDALAGSGWMALLALGLRLRPRRRA